MFNQLNDEEFCKEVENSLKNNLNKDKTNEEILVKKFGKSYSSIKQRYKRCSVKTIFATHERIRLEYALNQLIDKCCFEVMLDLGFDYDSNFTRWFKKHNNITPSEYKRLNT
jgi:AraC-like DNA-binding protein